jgi:hypothetical protein
MCAIIFPINLIKRLNNGIVGPNQPIKETGLLHPENWVFSKMVSLLVSICEPFCMEDKRMIGYIGRMSKSSNDSFRPIALLKRMCSMMLRILFLYFERE